MEFLHVGSFDGTGLADGNFAIFTDGASVVLVGTGVIAAWGATMVLDGDGGGEGRLISEGAVVLRSPQSGRLHASVA